MNTLFWALSGPAPSARMNELADQPSFAPPTSTVLLVNSPEPDSTPPLGRNTRCQPELTSRLWWTFTVLPKSRKNASLMSSSSRLYWNWVPGGRLWIIHELERNTLSWINALELSPMKSRLWPCDQPNG